MSKMEKRKKKGPKEAAWDVAVMGMMIATLEAGKMALSAAPNVEIVTLLVILYTLRFGKKTLYAVVVFVLLECAVWGIGLWTVMYLYLWPLLSLTVFCLRKIDSLWFWSIFSAVFGVMYGGLCSFAYLLFGGPSTAFAWWIAGIPWDLFHGTANFILMMVLYTPLLRVLRRIAPPGSEGG
ncbi:MAG: hypothetical protein HFI76_12630 [Lachnospiraceae bacterium]|nr:hypothetical protein [Lachnospiraceae bacterium]